MDTIEPNNEKNVVLTNHEIYFGIAEQSFREATQIMGEKHSNEKLESSIFTIKDIQIRKIKANIHNTISVVFSALCAEAFINYYAVTRISANHFKNYLDKLDVISKWIIIPKLVTGNYINPGSNSVEKLRSLITLRNKLVHFKTTAKKPEQLINVTDEDITINVEENVVLATIIQAKSGIEAIRKVVNDLKRIDQTVETEWLDKCQIISTLDYVKIS